MLNSLHLKRSEDCNLNLIIVGKLNTEVDNLLTSDEFKTLIGNAKARRRNTLAPVMRNTLFDIKQNFESKPIQVSFIIFCFERNNGLWLFIMTVESLNIVLNHQFRNLLSLLSRKG
jgi:hypothetical protein